MNKCVIHQMHPNAKCDNTHMNYIYQPISSF